MKKIKKYRKCPALQTGVLRGELGEVGEGGG